MRSNNTYEIEKHYLGQPFFKTSLSVQLINNINNHMDDLLKNNKQVSVVDTLSGKITKEWDSIWFADIDEKKEILNRFQYCIKNLDKDNNFHEWNYTLDSAWINDQQQHEYQGVHQHAGKSMLGLSSIIYLKVPDLGPEYTETSSPHNGRTTLIGNTGGIFTFSQYLITPVVGDMYIFNYDMKHCVYPFIGNGIRRSMSINVDIWPKKLD
tara:strand:+ start:66 stop:695 length:630 start_codon:yes stop_codon:yes gene_type:complete